MKERERRMRAVVTREDAESRLNGVAVECMNAIIQPVTDANLKEICLAVIALDVITQRGSQLFSLVQEWPDPEEPAGSED